MSDPILDAINSDLENLKGSKPKKEVVSPFDSGEAGLSGTPPVKTAGTPLQLSEDGAERSEALDKAPLPSEVVFGRETAAVAFQAAKGTSQQSEMQVTAAQAMIGRDNVPTAEEVAEDLKASPLESIGHTLYPFDSTRRSSWNLFYDMAQFLPEDDEPDNLDSLDSMQELAGVAVSAGLSVMSFPGVVKAWADGEDATAIDDSEAFTEMGENLYRALASGELEKRAEATQTPMLWGEDEDDFMGDTQGDTPRGDHIIDAVITHEEARRLAQNTNNPQVKFVAESLSTDVGRLLTGLALEIAIDPLWLIGPAKGAGIVSHADKAYTIARPLMESAAAMERIAPAVDALRAGDEFRRTVLLAVEGIGSAEEMAKARKAMLAGSRATEEMAQTERARARIMLEAAEAGGDLAVAEAKAALKADADEAIKLAEAARMAGRDRVAAAHVRTAEGLLQDAAKVTPESASGLLTAKAKQAEVAVKSWTSAAEQIRGGLRLAKSSSATAAVEKGTIAWHIPFATKTRYVIPAGSAGRTLKAIGDASPAIAGVVSDVRHVLKPLTKEGIGNKLSTLIDQGFSSEAALNALSSSERLASVAHNAFGFTKALPGIAWSVLNRVFGSRFIQPMYAKMAAAEGLASFGASGAHLSQVPFLRNWKPLKRVSPEIWDNYQRALTEVFNETEKLESLLFADIKRMQRDAKVAWSLRRRMAKKTPAEASETLGREVTLQELAQWGDAGYSIEHIMVEVGSALESGAGMMKARPELAPAMLKAQELVETVSKRTEKPRLQVANALAEIARRGEGDILAHQDFAEQLWRMKNALGDAELRAASEIRAAEAAASQRIGEIRAAQELLSDVSVEDLARGLLGVKAIGAKGEASAAAAYSAVLQAVGGDMEVARRIVLASVAYSGDMGTAQSLLHMADVQEVEKILAALKKLPAADTPKTPVQAIEAGVNDFLRSLEAEAAILEDVFEHGLGDKRVRIAGKEVFAGMAAEQFSLLMDTMAKRAISKARFEVGPDWDRFMRWRAMSPDPQLTGGKRLPVTDMTGINAELGAKWERAAELMDRAEVLGLMRLETVAPTYPLYPRVTLAQLAKGDFGPPGSKAAEEAAEAAPNLRKLKPAVTKETSSNEVVWSVADDYADLFTKKQQEIMDFFMREQQQELKLAEVAVEAGVTKGQVAKQLMNIEAKALKRGLVAPLELKLDGETVAMSAKAFKAGKSKKTVKSVEGIVDPVQRLVLEGLEAGDTTLPKLMDRLGLAKSERSKVSDALGRLKAQGYLGKTKGKPPKWGLTAEADELFLAAEKAAPAAEKAAPKADAAADAARAYLPEEIAAGIEAKDLKRTQEALKGAAFSDQPILMERIRQQVKSAKTVEEAEAAIVKAITPLFPKVGAPEKYMIQAYSTKLANAMFRANNVSDVERAMVNGVNIMARYAKRLEAGANSQSARTAQMIRSQQDMLSEALSPEIRRLTEAADEVAPRLPDAVNGKSLEDGDGFRHLKDWEEELWTRWAELTKGLSDRDRILVAFAGLRKESATLSPGQMEMLKNAGISNPMGQRMGDMPVELQKTADELSNIVNRYEDLYEEAGFVFTKDPVAMLKQWGVAHYVPHLETGESALGRAGVVAGLKKRADLAAVQRGGRSASLREMDNRYSLEMDAAEHRAIQGTIQEINAMRDSSSMILGLDPMSVLARYMQSNKAITNKKLITMLVEGGVFQKVSAEANDLGRMMPAAEVAAKNDLVPLISRKWKDVEADILFGAGRAEWEERFVRGMGLAPESVEKWLDRVAEEGSSIFATWQKDIPQMGTVRVVEDFYLSMRARQFAKGEELVDVPRLLESGMSYEDVAKMLNAQARELGIMDRKVDAKMLKAFFGVGDSGAMWQMYVPAAVLDSMEMMFKPTALDKADGIIGGGRDAWQAVNTWWKTRTTVMSVAFTVRNAFSNVMTNILDVGVGGALNPKTNMDASVLAQAAHWAEQYGSVAKAGEMLSKPLDALTLASMGPGERKLAEASHMAARAAWEANPIRLYLKDGLSFGDGATHSLDEALEILRARGVVSQAFTQMSDITTAERSILAGMATGNSFSDKIVKAASAAEDFVMVTLPAAMTAASGTPLIIGLPKKLGGEYVARYIENQARITNFMANVKRGGSYSSASEHVNKFLFNYGDLTSFQKSVMRLLIPFMTWNIKNLQLQFDVMKTSPYAYSTFHRIFSETGPQALKAMQDERADKPFTPLDRDRRLRQGEVHHLSKVQLPFPGIENGYVTGFGLPQEALVEKLGMIMGAFSPTSEARQYDTRNRNMRFIGESHVLLRMALEMGFKHHAFYDKPLGELTNGRLVAQSIAPVGLLSPELRDVMLDKAGIVVVGDYDERSGGYAEDPIIDARSNYLFGALPHSRVLRDASAVVDQYHTSRIASPKYGAPKGLQEVPKHWRIMDALSGMAIIQEDPALSQTMANKRREEVLNRVLESKGLTQDFGSPYVERN